MSVVGQVSPAQLVWSVCAYGRHRVLVGEELHSAVIVTWMHALTSSAKRITMLGLSEAASVVAPEVHICKQQINIAVMVALDIIAAAKNYNYVDW